MAAGFQRIFPVGEAFQRSERQLQGASVMLAPYFFPWAGIRIDKAVESVGVSIRPTGVLWEVKPAWPSGRR
jgi:hypothetical protein